MSGLIIAIVVIVILAIVEFAFAKTRARAKARERELVRRRDEVAGAHRSEAEDRVARAELAEQQAARERAEAELHETRASMHERGLADDELEHDRDRLGVDGESDRFERRPAREREIAREDEPVPPEERR